MRMPFALRPLHRSSLAQTLGNGEDNVIRIAVRRLTCN
jgi:hypothetical protein